MRSARLLWPASSLPSPRTPSPPAQRLNAELARILKRGYAWTTKEREEGLHCIGAPIFDHTGFVVATLSVSWPGFRYERGDEADKIEKVKAAAGRISTILGYEP